MAIITGLKDYQQDVIDDLELFLTTLDEEHNLATAFEKYWQKKPIVGDSVYSNDVVYNDSIPGVPRITAKVPTAGGKTYIACNAIRKIFDSKPELKTKAVVWFVPSDTILTQTLKNLKDPNHPYREKINADFNNDVVVVDKEEALFGHGINVHSICDQLTIFVLSISSFIETTRGDKLPKAYRQNGYLSDHVAQLGYGESAIEGIDPTSLIQVIASLNPVVIIDESHNFESNLRVDALRLINPSFILELTATPRDMSNIFSYVDAKKLKDANMVKLPVVVYNHKDRNDVLKSAIQFRNNLETIAKKQEEEGGEYIRPIVLLQAQPNTDEDNETFEQLKGKLLAADIPEDQIKIKTSGRNEIGKTDLLSRDCPVRYIITVNALKEGWDCPFAYILASMADKSSTIDVEQIVGRILRQPYAKHHQEEFLNLSYVFTASPKFRETLKNISSGLIMAGFSETDYRAEEKNDDAYTTQPFTPSESSVSLPSIVNQEDETSNTDDFSDINPDDLKAQENAEDLLSTLSQLASTASLQYSTEQNPSPTTSGQNQSSSRGDKKCYIRAEFEEAKDIRFPVFVYEEQGVSFLSGNGTKSITKEVLLQESDFCLEKLDHIIDFKPTETEAVLFDLEESDRGSYVTKQKQLGGTQVAMMKNLIYKLPPAEQKEKFIDEIVKKLRFKEIQYKDLKDYVSLVLKGISNTLLAELIARPIDTIDKFKIKINTLLTEERLKVFKDWIITGKISVELTKQFPEWIVWSKKSKDALSRGLYTEEGDMNDFEFEVISQVASMDNVLFWHRNPENDEKGYKLNGFIYHYPDFIICTNKRNIILLETKGDHLDGTDSKYKMELGRACANEANKLDGVNNKYHYFMVYESKQVENAYTVQQFLKILEKL